MASCNNYKMALKPDISVYNPLIMLSVAKQMSHHFINTVFCYLIQCPTTILHVLGQSGPAYG